MFWIGYRFFIFLFQIAISIKAIWDEKASKFLHGRIDHVKKISSWLKANEDPLIQIHCASLGEFELSLPLYNSLKERHPNHRFLFTFFSPSGYEHAKIPKGEAKSYLPIDRVKLVQDFLKLIEPKLVIFIKYEFWFTYINQLSKNKIPFGFVNINQQYSSSNFRFKTTKKLINEADFVCTSNDKSSFIFQNLGLKLSGQFTDLRYSHSLQISNVDYEIEEGLEQFLNKPNTIICGSVWKEDLSAIRSIIKKRSNYQWVLAPHELDSSIINFMEDNFSPLSYFSEGKIQNGSKVLVIDTIGDLKYLYKFGALNYIGGAFKSGLHNVIEPLYAGVPIVFGPNYENFPEAKYLLKNGLANSIKNDKEFDAIIEKMEKGSLLLDAPLKLQKIKEDLSKLTDLVTKAYETRS